MSVYETLRRLILPLDEIDVAVPNSGTIIELGCGQGVIATYLSKKSTRKVIGFDYNSERLPKTKKKNLSFKKADITNVSLPNTDCYILSDVLHHLNTEEQKAILIKIYKALEKKGTLIIKEIDTEELIRSNLSRLWDFILYPKDKISFLNSINLEKNLKKLGFQVTITRPCRFFPGSTTLFVCRK